MNISLKQLKCFVTVAQQQSFTLAAKVLHTTQSAVSLMIKELEDEVGFRLFDRTTRRVLLSDSGETFFRLAHHLMNEFQNVLRDASDIAALRKGVVRVGATEAVACSLVVPAIAAYKKERPGIDVQLVVTLVPSMFNALRNGDVDFILGPDSMRDEDVDLNISAEQLARSPIRLWCPASHPLARVGPVAWRTLLQYDLVIPALDFASRIKPAVAEHLGVIRIVPDEHETIPSRRMVGNITAALSMVKADLGVTFAAEYIRPMAAAFGLVGIPLVEPSLERIVMLYMRSGRTKPPAVVSFLTFFRRDMNSPRQ